MKQRFHISYKQLRLLLLHRSQYRSPFTKKIRKIFKRFGFGFIYDKGVGYIVELVELMRRKRIANLYREEVMRTVHSMSGFISDRPEALLDIGSGLGGVDLALFHSSESRPKIFLLDKDDISSTLTSGYHQLTGAFAPYNSFRLTCSFLHNNGIPFEKIATVDINKTSFPRKQKFDLVISLLAWGFHFPVEEYVKEVYETLSCGGSLVMDIRKGTDGIETLEAVFGVKSKILYEEEKFSRVGIHKPC